MALPLGASRLCGLRPRVVRRAKPVRLSRYHGCFSARQPGKQDPSTSGLQDVTDWLRMPRHTRLFYKCLGHVIGDLDCY
jgi:hypothetical protein